jgi:hypothetical protein
MKRDRYFDDFFPRLSMQLTLRIASANGELLAEDAALDEEDREEVNGDWVVSLDQRDETPPPELFREEAEPDEQLEACRRTIRERLYRYLAFLARSPRSRRGDPCPIFEVLPPAMGHLLGIKDSRFEELPHVLTGEFRDWLADRDGRYFHAAWGDMRLLDESNLKLTAEEAGREEPPRRARDSFPAYRPKSVRNR